jgi:hypothetical protein
VKAAERADVARLVLNEVCTGVDQLIEALVWLLLSVETRYALFDK